MSLQVRQLLPEDVSRWDEFVFHHPHGSPFHLIAWKRSIEETFGYRPVYLVAADGGAVQGVLPLFLVENLVLRRALISSPFAVYGGILARDRQAHEAIRERVQFLGEFLKVRYVELRNSYPQQCSGFDRISRYVTFARQVPPDEAALLQSLPKKTRNMVRKALKQGFAIRRQTSNFDAFEALYSQNMRRLGTPSFPRRHFAALLANFGGMIDIREVLLDGAVVAASLNFYFRDQMHTYYAASDCRYNSLAPNNYMYFNHLRWAGQNGLSVFDFGRCKKNTGTFEFKRHWGATSRELPYEALLVRQKHLPNYSPANPKFQVAIKVWQNLPLPITRALGPQFVRLFP